MAILSKTWWRSLVKGEESPGSEIGVPEVDNEVSLRQEVEDDFLFADLEVTETVVETELGATEGDELAEEPSSDRNRNRRNRRDGRRERREPREDSAPRIPPRAKVTSAKDFFAEEAIYRYDIMPAQQREELKGEYRIEVKGNKGGVWSIKVDTGLEIVNRREEANVVLSIQQRDFVQLVNGDLNPQMAILAQKMKVVGDLRTVATLQSLLVPPGFD